MSAIELAAGIDCGKHFLDVAVVPSGDKLRIADTSSGYGELIAWLGQHNVAWIGLEASGGYERPVRDALRAAGLTVSVCDPARVRFYARATRRPLLARFGLWGIADARIFNGSEPTLVDVASADPE